MSLLAALTSVRTEEDVKDAYIAALGLKGVRKGLVDIQTPEIWFESKETPTPPLLMFAQLLVYVRAARKRGEAIPGFLCVIDRENGGRPIRTCEHARLSQFLEHLTRCVGLLSLTLPNSRLKRLSALLSGHCGAFMDPRGLW